MIMYYFTINVGKIKGFIKICRNAKWLGHEGKGKEAAGIFIREGERKRMFKAAVCDDDSFFAERFKKVIAGYLSEMGIVFEIDTYNSGEALLGLGVGLVRYSAIFLDIHMGKMNGIAVAKKIREINRKVPIVFVTAYVDYSLEGYRFGIIRYLLKDDINFEDTFRECMDAIMDNIGFSVEKREFIFQEGAKEVLLDRLLYIESKLHKLEFHVMEGDLKAYTMYGTLYALEQELEEHGFVRIHQSYLVNIKYIKNVVRYKAILVNGDELAIPKARYAHVKSQLTEEQGQS